MITANSFIKKLGFKGLDDFYKSIVDKRIKDIDNDIIAKNIVEKKIKEIENGKIPSTYNESFRKYYKKYQSKRYKTDIKFRLDRNISRSIRRALKYSNHNKEKHWESILGYKISELRLRLKSTIPKGYIWQDYINRKLELDHIIPVNAFNYTNVNHIDFRKSWGLNNLRLIPKKENRIKSDNLKKKFQPALKLILNSQVISQ